jgi:hypothetical protein
MEDKSRKLKKYVELKKTDPKNEAFIEDEELKKLEDEAEERTNAVMEFEKNRDELITAKA